MDGFREKPSEPCRLVANTPRHVPAKPGRVRTARFSLWILLTADVHGHAHVLLDVDGPRATHSSRAHCAVPVRVLLPGGRNPTFRHRGIHAHTPRDSPNCAPRAGCL